MNFKLLVPLFLFLLAFMAPKTASGHAPDQSYIYLRVYQEGIGGRFELTSEYLNEALGLNLPEALSMSDLTPHLPRVYEYLLERTAFSANGKSFPVNFTEPTILPLKKEDDYIRFNFDLEGIDEVPKAVDLKYEVMFDKEENHRGLAIIEYNWKAGIHENEAVFSNIFEPSKTKQSIDLSEGSVWNGFVALIKLGVWHIWIGLDHILFIVALILPAVVRRRRERPFGLLGVDQWEPVMKFRPALLYIVKIVTFFTIAHSITLALASLNIINPPSYLVESIIAFSIGLAALHNIYPIFQQKEWIIAFAFGLFHGFGFASVLGDKGMGGDFLIWSLLGFNIGVEVGQLLIILAIFPLLYLVRKTTFYRYFIFFGSALLILIALHWTIERGFDVDIKILSTVRNFLGV